MATLAQMLNPETLDKLLGDPRLMLGLQLMQAGGPQAQQMSTGQRLAQAGLGYMDQRATMQQAQQLAEYRRMQMEAQQQANQQRQAEAQRNADLQRRMQDPAFLEQLGPLARAMAGFGATPAQIVSANSADQLNAQRQQRFDASQPRAQQQPQGSGARTPTPRQIIEEPLPDGRIQKHKLNPQTAQYEPFGAPFARGSGSKGTVKADPLDEILNNIPTDALPDTNAGPGPAVPGLPGSAPLSHYIPSQRPAPPQATDQPGSQPLAMAGAGSAQARKPSGIDAIVDQIAPQIAEPKTAEEYARLPKGTRYRDPVSGKVATKR